MANVNIDIGRRTPSSRREGHRELLSGHEDRSEHVSEPPIRELLAACAKAEENGSPFEPASRLLQQLQRLEGILGRKFGHRLAVQIDQVAKKAKQPANHAMNQRGLDPASGRPTEPLV